VPDLARPIALAIIQRDDSFLVFPVPDEVKKAVGYRPPGGTIEFGERGADTVVRELSEELDLEVVVSKYLGTLENIFTYLGRPGHELARIYQARFADSAAYRRDSFACIEADGAAFTCVWKQRAALTRETLYPEGLMDLLVP
jgi:ADP-ribose pyrophosphatase YjhB (NUDIX family)